MVMFEERERETDRGEMVGIRYNQDARLYVCVRVCLDRRDSSCRTYADHDSKSMLLVLYRVFDEDPSLGWLVGSIASSVQQDGMDCIRIAPRTALDPSWSAVHHARSIHNPKAMTHIWTLLGNDGHGRSADVSGAHAADLEFEFGHRWVFCLCVCGYVQVQRQ